MGLFNYENSGKGVAKGEEKKGIFKWAEVYFRHFWNITGVNLLHSVFFLPLLLGLYLSTIIQNHTLKIAVVAICCLVTAVLWGPATCALTKICRKYSQERPVFMLSDFKQSFNESFKQGCIMGIIDIVIAALAFFDLTVYYNLAKQNNIYYIAIALSISLLLLFFMMHFYIYLLISSTNLKLTQIIKNSFLLVTLGLKSSIIMLVLWIIMAVLMVAIFPYSLLLALFFVSGFLAFTNGFLCFPVIRKFVIQPYYKQRGEENPEFSYLRSEYEPIFEDKGGEEEPVVVAKKPKKSGKKVIK